MDFSAPVPRDHLHLTSPPFTGREIMLRVIMMSFCHSKHFHTHYYLICSNGEWGVRWVLRIFQGLEGGMDSGGSVICSGHPDRERPGCGVRSSSPVVLPATLTPCTYFKNVTAFPLYLLFTNNSHSPGRYRPTRGLKLLKLLSIGLIQFQKQTWKN